MSCTSGNTRFLREVNHTINKPGNHEANCVFARFAFYSESAYVCFSIVRRETSKCMYIPCFRLLRSWFIFYCLIPRNCTVAAVWNCCSLKEGFFIDTGHEPALSAMLVVGGWWIDGMRPVALDGIGTECQCKAGEQLDSRLGFLLDGRHRNRVQASPVHWSWIVNCFLHYWPSPLCSHGIHLIRRLTKMRTISNRARSPPGATRWRRLHCLTRQIW